MKGTGQFKQTIKAYLDERAKTDDLFAASYAKENKSLDGCIEYILSEVKKSGCNGFADEEIYGMAVHYYDEDNLKVEKVGKADVVVNHVVELSEDEKQKAKEMAFEQYKKECIESMKKQPKPKAPKTEKVEVEQMSLF